MSEDTRLGAKVRALRRRESMSQAQLAKNLEISPSYLNLIEHDLRPLSAPLLIKLTQLFQLDLQTFTIDNDIRLRSELMEAFGDPIFEPYPLTNADVREMALGSPVAAKAVLFLYQAYRKVRESASTLADRFSEDVVLADLAHPAIPSEEVSDFIQHKLNYFPELEEAAESLWRKASLQSDDLGHGLVRFLQEALDIRIEMIKAANDGGIIRRYDPARRVLFLSESLPLGSRNFQIAHQVGLLTQGELLARLAQDERLTSEVSRALGRVTLANYFAGAVLMPYLPFLEATREVRYDIELLGIRFGANFEQICHRLTSLRRSGAEGIPFHFVRVDTAGNISKRFSASGIHISRFGSCPRWNLHGAFLTPGHIITQLSQTPDGAIYFCLARTVTREARGYHIPKVIHAITLGCKVQYARAMVYADGVDLENLEAAVPIGTTCRICPRMDCEQRACPPLHQALEIDPDQRGITFYAPTHPEKQPD